MDCSPLGSSVHGILQARILEWVAIPFLRVSSQPRDWTQVSCIAGRFFTIWATKEAHITAYTMYKKNLAVMEQEADLGCVWGHSASAILSFQKLQPSHWFYHFVFS